MSYYSSIFGKTPFFIGIRPSPASSSAPFSNSRSVFFDGNDDYINLGTPANLSVTLSLNEFSVSAWIRPTSITAQRYIIAKAEPFAPIIQYALAVNSDGSLFGYFGGVGGFSTSGAASSVTANTWYHTFYTVRNVGGTYTGSLWLNGVQQGGNVVAGNMVSTSSQARIGAASASGAAALPFHGCIDEVTFWNSGFTSSQITALYNSGIPNSPTSHSAAGSLIHWYRMGDGDTFPVISDRSGSNSGTMTNMIAGSITTTVPV